MNDETNLPIDALEEARDRFKRAKDAWDEDRRRYVDDLRFLAGEHWPTAIKQARDEANRPCLVVDKLQQYVRQVVNDSRQNRPSIKVRPVDSDADVKTAEVLQGLCRHIEERSNADIAYDTALECGVKGGFGFVRILTEYAHERTFDQEIAIKRVRNPLTVYIDPDCQEPDASDMRWAFVVEELDEDIYKAQYPKSDQSSWGGEEKYHDWYGEKKIRVAEYWEVIESNKTVHLLIDGSTCTDEEYQLAVTEGLIPPQILQSRDMPVKTVQWSRINGREILKGPVEWKGRYIPIVPVWGNETDIDGKVIHTSMIHASKDAQRLYDFSRSAFAERVALTPKAPFIAADGQIENYESDWEQANTANIAVLKYTPQDVNGTPLPPPRREPGADIPAGFAQDMTLSEHDIQSSLGMYNATLGATSNEKSGKAILARQREGDVTNFHYHDNLARCIRQVGRIVIDLAPKIYDSTRMVRILGVDGKADQVQLDPTSPQSYAKVDGKDVYNIGVGVYDVAVSAGPSYTTRRQEAAEAMVQMTQGNPALFPLIGDLMIGSMDWPNADEISKRLKLMLPEPIKQAEQKDAQDSPEVQAVVMQAQEAIQRKDEMIAGAAQHIEALTAELNQAKQSREIDLAKIQIDMFKAETDRLKAEADANPENSAELDALRLQYEDKWKQLEADTRILLGEMQARTAVTTKMMEKSSSEIADPEAEQEAGIGDLVEAVNANMAQIMALQ